MSDENDILQKADALLHRRSLRHEPDFPVLTEVVDTFPQSPSAGASEISTTDLAEPPRTITHIDIEELEHRILKRILPIVELKLEELIRSTLLPQVNMLLESAIKEASEDVSSSIASRATEQLSDTIRATIQAELSKIGSRVPGS